MTEHISADQRGPAGTGDTVVILRRSGTYDGDAQYERIVDAAREALTNAGGEDEDEAAADAVLEALNADAAPLNSADHASTYRPVVEIHDERARQDQVWGQQNHADTHPADRGAFAAVADDWKRTECWTDPDAFEYPHPACDCSWYEPATTQEAVNSSLRRGVVMTSDKGEVPAEVHVAAIYPIADVELTEAEAERINAVIHATWRAACQWWQQHTHGPGNGAWS